MLRRLIPILSSVVLSASLAQSTATANHSAEVATRWFGLSLELVQQTPGFSPPVASRAFGYMGVTLYEAVVPGMPGHQSLAGQLNGLSRVPRPAAKAYHWPSVANSALFTLSRHLLQAQRRENASRIQALYEQLLLGFRAEPGLGQEVLARSQAHGTALAEAIFEWSRSDGGHQAHQRSFPADYVAPVGIGKWLSTPPAFARALQPYWGNNRPFVLGSGDECASTAPPAYSEEANTEFYRQALEVYQTSQILSDEQRQIALFWADDPGRTATPPGHWISILTQLVSERKLTLDRAAEAYAKLGMALADAFIGCWKLKYKYNLLRPVTYIRQVLGQQGWMPILDTPPFPEYPSGHSVQSAAAAQVLTQLFGENFAFTDHTHAARGLEPRFFASFNQAAEEAAISRLYGGIHYRAAIEDGLAQGRCIGARVSAMRFR